MTLDQIIDHIFIKEGDVYAEVDQPTGRGGITQATLQAYSDVYWGGKRITKLDLAGLTHDEARQIVRWKLERLSAEMGLECISFAPLRLQLLDFGYNSGGPRAIRWLQRVINVPPSGHMDAGTRFAMGQLSSWLIHHALIAARLHMIDSWTDAPENRTYEEGLENRALSFVLYRV